MAHTFKQLIQDFKIERSSHPDKVIEYTRNQNSLVAAIEKAVLSEDKDGKMHFHQCRVGRKKVAIFLEKVILELPKIEAASTFNELYKVLNSVQVKQVGLLAKYDIALRIGMFKKLYPKHIYLQCGSKEGVENLLNRRIKQRYVSKNELPEPFKSSSLKEWELEILLCVKKKQLKAIMVNKVHQSKEVVRC